jgi:hypothetical protein
MTTNRLTDKSPFNEEWGRISDDGMDAVPADVDPSGAFPNQGHEPLIDRWGRLYTKVQELPANAPQVYTTSFYQTIAYATSGDIKATPGTLIQVWGFNSDSTNMAWFQLFDEIGPPPANGTVPLISIPVAANNGQFSLALNQSDFGQAGVVPFDTNGIEWAVSSTGPTLTLHTTPFWVQAIYI